ncbi:hypothetical protein [Nocardiopsis trehalosi]|jgi:hypothetical protein|uniref:hypothetical protein n=1 Tax=Nocardiopsis trehalosi TaxID=109329 RepID=UPI000AF8E86E|nr:hypothetical protein [Nocardiopsis trehalosi]
MPAAPASAHQAGGHPTAAAEATAASWRLAYTFSTDAKCANTGHEGVAKGRWSSWYCQPTHDMTRFELWVQ